MSILRRAPGAPMLAAPANGQAELLPGLRDLLACDDFDEEFLAPTTYALATVQQLLAASVSRTELPGAEPAFSTIGDGSVYARWKCGEREVRILAPPAPGTPVRLYYRQGEEDGVEGTVTAESLAARLRWLQAG